MKKILAIETSCDDTCIAILESKKVLSSIVSSQIKIHKKYGGVYPALARREHQKNLVPVLKKALKGAGLLEKKISPLKKTCVKNILSREKDISLEPFIKKYSLNVDAIAVTVGPGLEPCLWTGVNFAKALAVSYDLPIIPVNHIEAHVLVNFLEQEKKPLPALCLIVSGGHTQLILMEKIGQYKIIGETRDDAAGECFDKTARILGLSYPGGPEIAKIAKKNGIINLPRPMIYAKNYDFSFSGLKTAVLYKTKKDNKKSQKYKSAMCYEIQKSIIDVLATKTIKAAKDYRVKTIILGGGVTANKELIKEFKKRTKNIFHLSYPESKLSTDNAVMTGITAYYKKPEKIEKIKAKANLKIE